MTLRALENRLYRALRDPAAARIADAQPVAWDPEQLRAHEYCLVMSYRRDGRGVATPVWFGIAGGCVYVRSGAEDGKVKRIRRTPRVLVAPCGLLGRPLGPPMVGAARILGPAEWDRAEAALRHHYGLGRRAYGVTRAWLLAMAYLEIAAP